MFKTILRKKEYKENTSPSLQSLSSSNSSNSSSSGSPQIFELDGTKTEAAPPPPMEVSAKELEFWEKALLRNQQYKCEEGHNLRMFKTPPSLVHFCDICKYHFAAESILYSCRQCDYDACLVCLANDGDPATPPTPPAKPDKRNVLPLASKELKHGISLKLLWALQPYVPQDANFLFLFKKVIRPLTTVTRGVTSFTEFLGNEDTTKEYISTKIDAFICLPSLGNFRSSLQAVSSLRTSTESDFIVYMDPFCTNVTIPPKISLDLLTTGYVEALSKVGRIGVILSPLSAPFLFERLWCCFEWYSATTIANLPITLCADPKEEADFVQQIKLGEISRDYYVALFAKIDVSLGKSSDVFDETALLRFFEVLGCKQVNDCLVESVSNYFIRLNKRALSQVQTNSKEHEAILISMAGLFEAFGDCHAALAYFTKAVQVAKMVPENTNGLLTALALNNVARLCRVKGDLPESEKWYREAFAILQVVYGADDPIAVANLAWIGDLLLDQGKLNEALPILRNVCEIRKRTMGSDHVETADALNNLAVLLDQLGEKKQAKLTGMEAASIYGKLLGETHAIYVSCKKDWD